jgi:hypothetical protein
MDYGLAIVLVLCVLYPAGVHFAPQTIDNLAIAP